MKNISFDNPYLLLSIIPLLLLLIVPVAIAIRRENRSKSVFVSLGLHILIAVCVTLALAGMMTRTVMTETQVYVVADVSYSSNRNLDTVDQYIQEIQEKLPENSKMGVVVFGKDYKVLNDLNTPFTTVKNSGVNDSATVISDALNHTVGLFDENVIKRIILITDGKETHTDAAGELVSAVENVYANDIYLDAIYLDNNLAEDAKEIQVSDVQFAKSTYKNHPAKANVLIQSSYDTHAIAVLSVNGERIENNAIELTKGYNTITLDLPTASTGRHEYTIAVTASEGDGTTSNNIYDFTQTVVGKLNILLVTWDEADLARVQELYGADAEIDAYVKDPHVPCTVEELCRYDEIVLSNFDVRDLENVTAFIDSVDQVVSRFGKSLVTLGDLKIQNKTDDTLQKLEDMLPVKYGNNDQDAKLYAIVLDTSRSMQNFSRLLIAKQASIQLLNMMNDDDYVMIVNFYGKFNVLQTPIKVEKNRESLVQLINGVQPYQGTVIGSALNKAGDFMIDMAYEQKQIMLISDGKTYALEKDDPIEVATKLYENGITVSTINTAAKKDGDGNKDESWIRMEEIAEAGGGTCFPITTEASLMDVMFSQVADQMTDSVIIGRTEVKIQRPGDPVLEGLTTIPSVMGYNYTKAKASATTVLTVDYQKNSKTVIEAPLFAYWSYGNGRVSSYTSTLTGEWAANWQNERGDRFFENVVETGIPSERIDYPYTINVTYDGSYSEVEIIPATLNPYATTEVTVTLPNGSQVTQQLTFDSERYFYRFETPAYGRYLIDITYKYAEEVYTAQSVFNLSYSPEYNCFDVFDPAPLHAAIRNRGTVYEGSIPSLVNDDKEIATYVVRYTVPLMILAVVLFVVDVIIRKLRFADLKSFFGIKPSKGGGR